MGSSYGRGRLHLAAAIDQRAVYDAGSSVELGRLAERGGLDFVTLDEFVERVVPLLRGGRLPHGVPGQHAALAPRTA